MKALKQPAAINAALISAGLFVGLISGCDQFMQKPRCPALDDCGGPMPIGTWVLAPGHASCSENVYVPPVDTRLTMGTVAPAGVRPPDPALYDWCNRLVTSGGDKITTREALFYYYDAHIGIATVRYQANGTFSAGLTTTGTYTMDLPGFCVRNFGAKDKPGEPMAMPPVPAMSVCDQLGVAVRESGIGEGAFPEATCKVSEIDPAGCSCSFKVTATAGPAGSYEHKDGSNKIVNSPGTGFPQKVTYCHKKDEGRLLLTGADGQFLFDKMGLRTMDLIKDPTAM